MKIIRKNKFLKAEIDRARRQGCVIGFVPTMGSLHEGHSSLIRAAKKKTDFVVVSIFVNPTQFGPKEDFKKYPRNLKRDQAILTKEKVDVLFVPSENEVYPAGFSDFIEPGPLARPLCGKLRPGHFKGVATVVNRLLELVTPDVAFFGEKDFQQGRVIESMVERRKLPVQIELCPLIRDRDGLALSSRNRYLGLGHRKRALSLYRSLVKAADLIQNGCSSPKIIKKAMNQILKENVDHIEYVEVLDPISLKKIKRIRGPVLAAVACFIGSTRLIDNMVIKR